MQLTTMKTTPLAALCVLLLPCAALAQETAPPAAKERQQREAALKARQFSIAYQVIAEHAARSEDVTRLNEQLKALRAQYAKTQTMADKSSLQVQIAQAQARLAQAKANAGVLKWRQTVLQTLTDQLQSNNRFPASKRINLNLVDSNPVEAFKTVLTQANIAYSLDSDLPTTGTLTLKIENISLNTALDLLAESVGVRWRMETLREPGGTVKTLVRIGSSVQPNYGASMKFPDDGSLSNLQLPTLPDDTSLFSLPSVDAPQIRIITSDQNPDTTSSLPTIATRQNRIILTRPVTAYQSSQPAILYRATLAANNGNNGNNTCNCPCCQAAQKGKVQTVTATPRKVKPARKP